MPRFSSRVLTALGVSLATAGVVASASMVWGSHRMGVPGSLGGGVGIFETTGWKGRLLIGPLALPNWLTVFAAALVFWCCWLRAVRIGNLPAAVPIVFVLYGIAHSGTMIFIFSGSARAKLGPGAPIATLAFVAMLVLIGLEVIVESKRKSGLG